MHFPVSGIDAPLWLPPLVGFLVAYFASMSGLSGAFILLPFQVSVLGYTAPSVTATNQVYSVIGVPSGVYRYIREGRMVWPLTWAVIIGTLPGVLVGAWVRVTFLPDPRNFKLFVGCVLLYIGARLVRDTFWPKTKDEKSNGKKIRELRVTETHFSLTQVSFSFDGRTHSFAPSGIFALCFLVGIVGGIYGIGGAAILSPVFVSVYRLPIYTVAGATLMGTFITSLVGVGFYYVLAGLNPEMNVAPDLFLGFLFGLGGILGMYLGARSQKYVPAKVIRTMLSAALLFVAGRYVIGFFR